MIYAVGDIAPRLLSFITFPILTAYLSLDDYGIINYVNTIAVLLTTIGFLCLNTYYLVYYYKVGTVEQQKKLLGNLSIFVVGINLALALLLFGIGTVFPNVFSSKIDFFPYIALGIVTNFFNILAVLPSALYRVKENPLPLTALNVTKGVLTMVLTLVLVVKYQYTALGVLWANLVVSIVFGLIFLWVTLRNMTWHFDYKQIKTALKFSLPLLPGSLAYYFLSMSDRLFIERYLNLADLGTYSTAATLAMILSIITYGAYKAFEPHFFKIYGTNDFNPQFIKVQNAFILVTLFGAMGLSLFAKEFFQLFSSAAYQGVYYYVPMVEVGVVFAALGMLYGTIVTAREKTKINSIVTIVGGAISVLLNIVLLPYIGIVAACLASGVSLGVIMCLSAYFAKLKISFAKPILAFFIAAVFVWFGVYVIDVSNIWIAIVLKTVMLTVATFLIAVIFGLKLSKLLLPLRK